MGEVPLYLQQHGHVCTPTGAIIEEDMERSHAHCTRCTRLLNLMKRIRRVACPVRLPALWSVHVGPRPVLLRGMLPED